MSGCKNLAVSMNCVSWAFPIYFIASVPLVERKPGNMTILVRGYNFPVTVDWADRPGRLLYRFLRYKYLQTSWALGGGDLSMDGKKEHVMKSR